MALDRTDRLRHYYLPGEERAHFSLFTLAAVPVHGHWGLCRLAHGCARRVIQLVGWSIHYGAIMKTSRALTVPHVMVPDLRPWVISDREWATTEDAAMARRWDAARNVDCAGVPIERPRRRAY
jgi:hypothetical protein